MLLWSMPRYQTDCDAVTAEGRRYWIPASDSNGPEHCTARHGGNGIDSADTGQELSCFLRSNHASSIARSPFIPPAPTSISSIQEYYDHDSQDCCIQHRARKGASNLRRCCEVARAQARAQRCSGVRGNQSGSCLSGFLNSPSVCTQTTSLETGPR